jgi:hypothetical protein
MMTAPLLGGSLAHQNLQDNLFDHLRPQDLVVDEANALLRVQV